MDKFGLYIHIPFCERKCYYCDFLSFACAKDRHLVYRYFMALQNEIRLKKNSGIEVSSVYFGGGTPSIVKAGYIRDVMDALRESFRFCDDVEITAEVNPGTVDMRKLEMYKTVGINRISIGVQSADDNELSLLGRIHDFETAKDAFYMARKAGFENINIDVMMALPGQTFETYSRTLKEICDLGPEHISAYSLILEPGTVFFEKYFEEVDEETDRKMYRFTREYLKERGYARYEISNFAREGYECRHNTDCWKRRSCKSGTVRLRQ